jgi:hypothetical protein
MLARREHEIAKYPLLLSSLTNANSFSICAFHVTFSE